VDTYSEADRDLDLRWWAAANYLTVAQIYLKSNPLLREPLTVADIKPRLLGHWGTSPGLSMIYTLLNRLIRATDADCIYVTGARRWWRTPTSRAPTARSTHRSRRTSTD
jgi:xylulose-5-phosphate/fructose-6-phosphate phosphoketolase